MGCEAMRKFSKRKDEAEINMTPMLDIVFIMLIFFIVTASFTKEFGLEINKPPPSEDQPKDEKNKALLIQVDRANRIFIDFRLVDLGSVRANIERFHAENPKGPVVIQAAPDTKAGVVVSIYDQARQAGVYNVSIAEPRE